MPHGKTLDQKKSEENEDDDITHPLEGWFNQKIIPGEVVCTTEVPAAKVKREFWE